MGASAREFDRVYRGRDILVGITCLDPDGAVLRQEQYHGEIVGRKKSTITIRRFDDKEEVWIPRDFEAVRLAPAGTYGLRSSGVTVTNPTFLVSWMYTVIEDEELGMHYEIEPNFAPMKESRVPKEWDHILGSPGAERIAWMIEHFARQYAEKTIIVGFTHQASDGTILGQEQRVGLIVGMGPTAVVIRDESRGETFTLPPDLSLIEKAPPGEYRLRSDGRVVNNPDYITSWSMTRPEPS